MLLSFPFCVKNVLNRYEMFFVSSDNQFSFRYLACSFDTFKQFLKTILFSLCSCDQRIRGFCLTQRQRAIWMYVLLT